MRDMKKRRICAAIVSLVMCFGLLLGAATPAFAEFNLAQFLAGFGVGDGSNINLTQWFMNSINEEINKESKIDTWVENMRAILSGADPRPIEEDKPVKIEAVDAQNAAELFDLTVNEIKRWSPSFMKTTYASVPYDKLRELEDWGVYLNAFMDAMTRGTSVTAAMINAYAGSTPVEVSEKHLTGNPTFHDVSVKGQQYVTKIDPADITSCSVDLYSKSRYTIRIDFRNCTSDDPGGLVRVFDFPDTVNNKLLTAAAMHLKYTDCWVSVTVDSNLNVSEYTTNYTATPLFYQGDGTWSTFNPFIALDFGDMTYTTMTTYDRFSWVYRQLGDANNDHKVNANDARMVLRASAQLVELGTYDLYYMDIDGNGRITASDARTLLRYSAKLCELPTSDKVPTAKITYQRPAEDKEKLADLRLLMAAYQAAQNEKERQALEEAYYNKYFNNETTTAAETTTRLRGMGDDIENAGSIIGDLADIIGGLWGRR